MSVSQLKKTSIAHACKTSVWGGWAQAKADPAPKGNPRFDPPTCLHRCMSLEWAGSNRGAGIEIGGTIVYV